jgi:hypothetical protein
VDPRTNAIWLTWHDAPRSRNLARIFGAPVSAYTERTHGFLRHVSGSAWTVARLLQCRPATVFLQNSFMLLLIVVAYKALAPWPTIVVADCHNKSLKRRLTGPLAGIFRGLKAWSFRRTDLVIVSNAAMVDAAHEWSERVAVLRDPLPAEFLGSGDRDQDPAVPVAADPYVLFPCSFEPDEPVGVIFATATTLARAGIASVVTGDVSRIAGRIAVPSDQRVRFSGYVPIGEYRSLVRQAAVIVALTEDPDCLMCAAYEGLAAQRPLVISDTPVLRSCFGRCAIYTRNTADDVCDRVTQILAADAGRDRGSLDGFIAEFRRELDDVLRAFADLGIALSAPEVRADHVGCGRIPAGT